LLQKGSYKGLIFEGHSGNNLLGRRENIRPTG
jgi:hypothetical protein